MATTATQPSWPLWRKIVFRFFFIYLIIEMQPWSWLDEIFGLTKVTGYLSYPSMYFGMLLDWLSTKANALFFHIRPVLVAPNGSGDTSGGWSMLWTVLCLSLIGCIIWSALDFKRKSYSHLNYWLLLFARYYIAFVLLIYGIEKLFGLQMYFPSLHQLATPLGDLLPMRFSWFFIGYSTPYQVFSGAMEVIAALLLLYRRTTTLGVLMATAVLLNVAMLNLCYDIPVKIYSMQLEFTCLFLLANETERILCFFVLNKPAANCGTYHFRYTKRWMRIARISLKIIFILVAVGFRTFSTYQYYLSNHQAPNKQPVKNGVYEVKVYKLNKDTIPLALSDTLRWQDAIFEDGLASVKSGDTSFRQRYKRGYFSYRADTIKKLLNCAKMQGDTNYFMSLHYAIPDSNTVKLWGTKGLDSLYIELKRTNRHFQLAERQFHWLSEHNR